LLTEGEGRRGACRAIRPPFSPLKPRIPEKNLFCCLKSAKRQRSLASLSNAGGRGRWGGGGRGGLVRGRRGEAASSEDRTFAAYFPSSMGLKEQKKVAEETFFLLSFFLFRKQLSTLTKLNVIVDHFYGRILRLGASQKKCVRQQKFDVSRIFI
jgi:hypothetical protein